MRGAVAKILDLLTPREKKTGLFVLALVLLMALIETAGIASVMPFLAVLGNPQVVETNEYLARVYAFTGFGSTQDFLTALGIFSFTVVASTAFLRLGTHYVLQRWVHMRRHSISSRLLAAYLSQPYEFFLERNTADLSKAILSEVEELVLNVFLPGVTLLAYGVTAVVLVTMLLLVDRVVALLLVTGVGGSYLLVYLTVRGKLRSIGRERAWANRDRFMVVSEALGGIKELKLLGREAAYLRRFEHPSATYSHNVTTNSVLSLAPKYLIEAVGFGGVLLLATLLVATRGGMGEALPMLGLYAFAGYRLLPSIQNVFASLTRLRFGLAAVDVVHGDATQTSVQASRTEVEVGSPSAHAATARFVIRDVGFRNVSYTYPGSHAPTLSDVSFSVPPRGSLGVIGATGAGKTTVVDILLGLLEPQSGDVVSGGRSIRDIGVRNWQRSIGYVPQQIYLIDGTVAENIAVGVAPEEIDYQRVESVARIAQIHQFVTTKEASYHTMVGERGIRISGGQRQRIGIARALYHDPDLLVFDEATNALDVQTETLTMQAITAVRGRKSLVMVAHRLNTVRCCERILVIEEGRIVGLGSYEELRRSNATFRRMAV